MSLTWAETFSSSHLSGNNALYLTWSAALPAQQILRDEKCSTMQDVAEQAAAAELARFNPVEQWCYVYK